MPGIAASGILCTHPERDATVPGAAVKFAMNLAKAPHVAKRSQMKFSPVVASTADAKFWVTVKSPTRCGPATPSRPSHASSTCAVKG